MFNLLADMFPPANRSDVFRVHPGQLSRWLDELWGVGPGSLPVAGAPPFLGQPPGIVNALDTPPAGAPSFHGPSGINPASPGTFSGAVGPIPVQPIWHHLAYAYLIENTGAAEIIRELVRLSSVGERFTVQLPSVDAIQWLRSTEELFFRDAPSFTIASAASYLRPDVGIVRRNAYWRMFGLDLSHPGVSASAGATPEWKKDVGLGVNTGFREKWSEFLRQVWLGHENSQNTSGANATDNGYISLICQNLQEMLNMRRRGGMLAREEFVACAFASWLELTLEADTPIIQALSAQAESPADRLALVAQRVGMAPAPRSRELFLLAPLVSLVLRIIETGFLNQVANAPLLYVPGAALTTVMNQIIDLWQSASGERVKDRPSGNVVGQQSAQPVRIPSPQPVVPPIQAPVMNGARR